MPSHVCSISTYKVSVHAAMINSAAKNNFRKMRLLTRALLRFRDLEAVACSTDCLQIARLVGVLFDFLTDAAHINVHRSRRDVVGVAPNRIQHLVACDHSSGMTGEIFQQAEFGGRGLGELAADQQRHATTVNLEVTSLHD